MNLSLPFLSVFHSQPTQSTGGRLWQYPLLHLQGQPHPGAVHGRLLAVFRTTSSRYDSNDNPEAPSKGSHQVVKIQKETRE